MAMDIIMLYSHGHRITIQLLETVRGSVQTVVFANAVHVGFTNPT